MRVCETSDTSTIYSLGIEVEGARQRLHELVDQGIPYTSPEMRKALEEFQELDRQWKALEQEHLQLRAELANESQTTE